jgi:hypothetical protein
MVKVAVTVLVGFVLFALFIVATLVLRGDGHSRVQLVVRNESSRTIYINKIERFRNLKTPYRNDEYNLKVGAMVEFGAFKYELDEITIEFLDDRKRLIQRFGMNQLVSKSACEGIRCSYIFR